MAYSTITKKKCKGEGCKRYPQLGLDGWCWHHAPEEIKEQSGSKKKLQIKNSNARKAQTVKLRTLRTKIDNGEVWEKKQLDLWFENIAKEIAKNPYCWETGEFISESDYRNATAHIFPKSIFKSIQTHPLNYLILSPRNGSHDLTHRLDRFSKMKVWKIAVSRFIAFEDEITERHKYLNLFREYAANKIV